MFITLITTHVLEDTEKEPLQKRSRHPPLQSGHHFSKCEWLLWKVNCPSWSHCNHKPYSRRPHARQAGDLMATSSSTEVSQWYKQQQQQQQMTDLRAAHTHFLGNCSVYPSSRVSWLRPQHTAVMSALFTALTPTGVQGIGMWQRERGDRPGSETAFKKPVSGRASQHCRCQFRKGGEELKSAGHLGERVSINSQSVSVVEFFPFWAPDLPAKWRVCSISTYLHH